LLLLFPWHPNSNLVSQTAISKEREGKRESKKKKKREMGKKENSPMGNVWGSPQADPIEKGLRRERRRNGELSDQAQGNE
jgi:hypothetical protein